MVYTWHSTHNVSVTFFFLPLIDGAMNSHSHRTFHGESQGFKCLQPFTNSVIQLYGLDTLTFSAKSYMCNGMIILRSMLFIRRKILFKMVDPEFNSWR